ncbi:MAG: hypothetical protein AAF726_01675 [Planctomycetota bacterium]
MGRLAFMALVASTASTAFGQVAVELRVEDQKGVEIRGATVGVDGAAAVPTGTTVQLDDGTHDFAIHVNSALLRTERAFVPPAPTTLSFEWITSSVRLSVVDHRGGSLRGSSLRFRGGAPPGFRDDSSFGSGARVTLPITDAAVYPTISGTAADGYDLTVLAATSLERDVSNQAVTAATTAIAVEWRTADVTVRVVDQLGAEIAGSFLRLRHSGVGFVRPTTNLQSGSGLTLPLTDRALYPTLRGLYGDGYDFVVAPLSSGALRRDVDDRDVTDGTTEIAFEWIRAESELTLVGSDGSEVFGSTLVLPTPFGTLSSGDVVQLPITDNAAYPTLFGEYADGYPIEVAPADVAPQSATLQFEVAADGTLTPGSFTVGPNTYSLRSRSNAPPTADAGENVTIVSTMLLSVTLAGSASDPDGDMLTYRWLDGSLELLPPTPVALDGGAPLDLSTVALGSAGSRTLTLEVSDGEFTATDTMVLTVGNAAPEAVCSGSGTFVPGVDVLLAATVADHDGDLVSYDWSLGGTVVASGLVQTTRGGAPVDVPLATVPAASLALGLNVVVLAVQDAAGASATCSADVRIEDVGGPTLAPEVSVRMLWPARHRLVKVKIDANASTPDGGPVTLSAVVRCSQDADRKPCGEALPDFTTPVIDQATGRILLKLRSSRPWRGDGKIYTVVITATDQAGNTAVAEVDVVATPDRRCDTSRWKEKKRRILEAWRSRRTSDERAEDVRRVRRAVKRWKGRR